MSATHAIGKREWSDPGITHNPPGPWWTAAAHYPGKRRMRKDDYRRKVEAGESVRAMDRMWSPC